MHAEKDLPKREISREFSSTHHDLEIHQSVVAESPEFTEEGGDPLVCDGTRS